MPGRHRLTQQDLDTRISLYNTKYGVEGSDFPPFPAGEIGTPQHREWSGLYKLKHRLARRSNGQCERCAAARDSNSVFCREHRAINAGRAGRHLASLEIREKILDRQRGLCPLCQHPVSLWDDIDHEHNTGKIRGLLHNKCNRALGHIEQQPGLLERVPKYLGW